MAAPPLVEPCRACDEAKYEVIFEGLWSRHTHPKDFPSNEWQTAFSYMIGASHSIDSTTAHLQRWDMGPPRPGPGAAAHCSVPPLHI